MVNKYDVIKSLKNMNSEESGYKFLEDEGKIINVKRSHPALYETLSSYVQE